MTAIERQPDEAARKESSTRKLLHILDFFDDSHPAWTVEMLMRELGTTRPTTYRYVKALCDCGLLAPGAGGTYVLGPRIIQLDRQMQVSSPLLKVAIPILAEDTSPVIGSTVISCFYGEQVLSIYVDKRDPDIVIRMERGEAFPLIDGAPSLIILAHLPPYQMKKFYNSNAAGIAEASLGASFEEFRKAMRAMRKAGYCVGYRLNPLVKGVAAPIFHDASSVSASVCYVRRADITSDEDLNELTALTVRAAKQISEKLRQFDPSANKGLPTPRMSG
ncbi:MAG: helix-turn-helix domain-containing protein [Rhodobiaceae bacterium]|nr:helix-turn-helix domain-containing protein [Rhodobiaceae bacterium]MCC0056399.1 helix-turn-helix domain-containing protein [Rhodobiaceae bacterium]